MSLESNRADFEKALEEMKNTMELLDHCVDDALMDTLKNVANEYEHYVNDIDELIDSASQLQDELDSAVTTNGELQATIDELESELTV